MKIFIASDSYKGCMSSREANYRIEKGLHKADPQAKCSSFCISDGGEGFVEAFAQAFQARVEKAEAHDLYGRPLTVSYAWQPERKTVCVEAASVLGLTLYPRPSRRPMEASSHGLGQLCAKLIRELSPQQVVIGLGGTGTNDGGMGFLGAFGARFYDRSRHLLRPSAQNLSKIAFIDKREFSFPASVQFVAACDVSNPFIGENGATHVFGRQKGLRPFQIAGVEKAMSWFCAKIDQTFHVNLNAYPGAGAAGGLGGMLGAVFDARIESGIRLLASGSRMIEEIQDADLVITGEGQSDEQSANGKAVAQIGKMASQYDKPVVVISGALSTGYEKLYDLGIDALFSTADRAMSFSQALKSGPEKLEAQAENIMRLLQAAERIYRR